MTMSCAAILLQPLQPGNLVTWGPAREGELGFSISFVIKQTHLILKHLVKFGAIWQFLPEHLNYQNTLAILFVTDHIYQTLAQAECRPG